MQYYKPIKVITKSVFFTFSHWYSLDVIVLLTVGGVFVGWGYFNVCQQMFWSMCEWYTLNQTISAQCYEIYNSSKPLKRSHFKGRRNWHSFAHSLNVVFLCHNIFTDKRLWKYQFLQSCMVLPTKIEFVTYWSKFSFFSQIWTQFGKKIVCLLNMTMPILHCKNLRPCFYLRPWSQFLPATMVSGKNWV